GRRRRHGEDRCGDRLGPRRRVLRPASAGTDGDRADSVGEDRPAVRVRHLDGRETRRRRAVRSRAASACQAARRDHGDPERVRSPARAKGGREMIRRGAWVLAVGAAGGVAGDVTTAQGQPASAKSQELYQNVYSGWKWWHVYCYRCHGTNAVGTTLAPNLTDPNEKMPLLAFKTVVKTGSADGQMQAWDKLLDDKQIAQLFDYVRARADKVLPPGRPDEVGPKGGPWAPPPGWSPQR